MDMTNDMERIAVLLPITFRGSTTQDMSPQGDEDCLEDGEGGRCEKLEMLRRLAGSLGDDNNVAVVIGVDATDARAHQLLPRIEECFRRWPVRVRIFGDAELGQHPPGALCFIWDLLAEKAEQEFRPTAFVLLGDDTEVQPKGWPGMVLRQFREQPHLICVKLVDQGDPGFPSFPVLHRRHLQLFGTMVPADFVNQGFDPFVDAVYRRVGASAMCPIVSVTNHIGGPQVAAGQSDRAYVQPRYPRRPLAHGRMLQLVEEYADIVRRKLRRCCQTLDVAVPSYRVDLACLRGILSLSVREPDVDVRFIIIVDNPHCPQHALQALAELQRGDLLGRLCLRKHDSNQGASAARNRALDESLGEWVLLLDDDVTPSPHILDAYVLAIRAHPEESGFAGPTMLPYQPRLFPCAFHISDASFFWDAPLHYSRVPWAVTANMLVKNTLERFDLRYPKTGGGEDIDFCLRACGGGMVAVPQAVAEHPWWGGDAHCFKRFFMWAYGDSQLIEQYPRLAYFAAPNSTELGAAALVLAVPVAVLAGPAAAWKLLASALAVKAADVALDVIRNCTLPRRIKQRPCPPALRLPAVLEGNLVKTWSEAGRLWGQLSRGRLVNVMWRFDWFCGWLDPAVRRKEQYRSIVVLAAYICALLALHSAGSGRRALAILLSTAVGYRFLLPLVE